MSDETDPEIMKRCLKDVGIFEENMSMVTIRQYYKAIKESESTANKENTSRKLRQTDEDLLKELDETINEPSTSRVEEENIFDGDTFSAIAAKELSNVIKNEDQIMEDSDTETKSDYFPNDSAIKDVSTITLSYSDMCIENNSTILPIKYHKLKYVAIQNSENYINSDRKGRVEMMKEYFETQAKYLTKLAKISKHKAPLPKPIMATFALVSSSSFSDDLSEDTYISRSGRQTKRKIYNYDEDDSSQEENILKRNKNEDENWLSKSTSKNNPKSYTRKKPDTSIASELFDKEIEKDKNGEFSPTENKENNRVGTANSESSNKPPPKRTVLNKRLSNKEIMQRSPLFSDTPNKKSRAEEILEKARETEEQKLKEERQTDTFVRKLDNHSQDSGDEFSMDIIETIDDEPPVRRRIIPTLPGRKGIRKNKSAEPLPITSSPTRRAIKTNIKQQSLESQKQDNSNVSLENGTKEKSSHNDNAKGNKVPCPLCSALFRETDIEAHASTCCDDDNVRARRSTTKISSIPSKITCEICDKQIPLDTNYEVHVKDCLAKRRE